MNFLHRTNPLRPMASDASAVRRRAMSIGAGLFMCMVGLVWRSITISVVQHEDYAERGNRQQIRSYTLDASRGEIVDRSYIALAVNDRVHKVVLNPRLIHASGARDSVLATLLELFPHENPEYLKGELERDKAYRRLRPMLDDDKARLLEAMNLPGVSLEQAPHRVYPRKHLAAHVIGRVNGQGKGNLGIEYELDEYLRGRDAMSPAYWAGHKKLLVDGFPDPGVSRGHTVVLTIDSAIQAMVEEEIDTLVAEWRPVGASILVLDPRNGEVLAMANRPLFDPNHPVPSLEQTINLATQAAYEPGSTMKAITVAAALETGAIRKDQTFFCENGRWRATSEYDIKDTKPAQWLSVTDILAVSSNICTAKISQRLGLETLYDWVHKFHFGRRPPIRLPGATAGLLAHYRKWSEIQGYNISFGQGMSASPLQVAAAFAALANDGIYHPPTIVRRIIAGDGTIAWAHRAEPERLVRVTTARTVMKMLESVVHDRIGTGKNARIEGYRVAGKTSTAQMAGADGRYDEDLWYASFVGAVPSAQPRVVILVSVDRPEHRHYGNDVAAPAFARLGARIMTHLAVPRIDGTTPTPDPIALASSDERLLDGFAAGLDIEPRLPGQRGVRHATGLPDFTGLSISEALDVAQLAHVRLIPMGSGVAVMQDTPPGPVARGTSVRVLFEPPA